jgi:hypothetical protein
MKLSRHVEIDLGSQFVDLRGIREVDDLEITEGASVVGENLIHRVLLS